MKSVSQSKINAGVSLVELIVVIAIMAIMTGLLSIGVSLMFSRDAESVAKVIDGQLTEARMLSMSRAGKFELMINVPNNSVDIIKNNDTTNPYKTTPYKKNVTLAVKKPDALPTDPPDSITSEYKVEFDKSNGSVIKMNGIAIDPSAHPETSGVYSILATSGRLTNKTSTVEVITTTGRHYVKK